MGEFGGDNRAGLGGRQHSERGAGKSGGLRATHELHNRSCFDRIRDVTVFHRQESKHNHPRLLGSN